MSDQAEPSQGMSGIMLMELKHVSAADVEDINRLLSQLSKGATPLTMPEIGAILRSSDHQVYAAVTEDETTIVGVVIYVTRRLFVGIKGLIEDVVVDEQYRGRGIGRALMERAINNAPAGTKCIDLTSRPERVIAGGLYESLGFVGRKTRVYRLMLGA